MPAVKRLGRLARELLRAVVLGVATLFLGKPERGEHWSTPPTAVTVVLEREAQRGGSGQGSGQGKPPGDGGPGAGLDHGEAGVDDLDRRAGDDLGPAPG
jgi:hypothetical protein